LLVHALENTPHHAPDLERAIRLNLAAWSREVHALRASYPFDVTDLRLNVLDLSPDGKTFLKRGEAKENKAVQLWDVATGRPVGLPLEHELFVYHAAFSPDGKMVATAGGKQDFDTGKVQGQDAGAAWLWDVSTRKQCGQPLPHPRTVVSVAFSRDGKTLLT